MIFPTINDLNEGKYNRYEVALATAKCARMITNEYVRQRAEAECSMTGNKETDRPLNTMIDREVRDEKAVNIAVRRMYEGDYVITHKSVEEQEQEEQAVLESISALYRPYDRRDEDEDGEGEHAIEAERSEAAEEATEAGTEADAEGADEDADEGGAEDADEAVDEAADEAVAEEGTAEENAEEGTEV